MGKHSHNSKPRRPNADPPLRPRPIQSPSLRKPPRRHELQRAAEPEPIPRRPPPVAPLLEHGRDRALQHHRRHREDEDREQYRRVEQRLAPEGEEPGGEALAVEPAAVIGSAGPEELAIGGQALGAIPGGVIGA